VSTRIKVCGITRLEDALACVEAGVDAVGFNFWPGSKRHVAVADAAEIAAALPPGILRVGVFVRARPSEVRSIVAGVGLGAVQLHGDEDPADYLEAGAPLWQVLRIESSLPETVSARAAEVLLDAKAVRRAEPTGVDVASGVESRPRMKDPALVRAFVAAVRAAEER